MISIENLAHQPGRDVFDCGVEDMNEWLAHQAGQSDRRGTTLTRVAVSSDDGRVVGYYTTKAYEIRGEDLQLAFGEDGRRYPVPSVLLARLATCLSVRGQGVGELLLLHAIRAAIRVSENTGVEMVVVHALGEEAAAFYLHYGFDRFRDHPNHLLITIKKARKAFDS